MVYDVVTDQWSELSRPVKPVSKSAMVFFNGRLVVTGGRTNCKDQDTVQTFDIENYKWWLEKNKLPLPLSSHAAIVAKVPQSLHSVSPSLLSGHMLSLFLLSLILPLVLILSYFVLP